MNTIPTDLTFYAFAIPAVLIAGISKAGFGGASGGLAVVLLAQVVPPGQAAAIMLPILCTVDIFGVRAYWKKIDWALLKRMLPAAIVGTIVGALMWKQMSVPWLKLILGVIAISFPLWWWFKAWRARSQLSAPTERGALSVRDATRDKVRAASWCGLAGFTSFVAHAGGPPVLAYLLPKQLDKSIQVGTMSFFFLIVNYVKLPQYFLIGQLQPSTLWIALVLAPFIPLGVWLGLHLHNRLSQRAFQQACYVLMLIMGAKLLMEAFAAFTR